MKRFAICLAAFVLLFSSSTSRAENCQNCGRSPIAAVSAARTCGQPVCTCRTQTLRPVTETRLRPQQVVTHRDVPTVQYRQQAITQNVPVTQYQNITVDQGHYKTVWVPKLVTQQVAKTTYVPKTTYRTVPQVVNRRVAQVQTQMVPERTVRYVPQTTQFTFQPRQQLFAQTVAPVMPMRPVASTFGQCDPCHPTAAFNGVPSTAYAAPIYPTTPITAYQTPYLQIPTAQLTHAAPITGTSTPVTLGATASRTNDDLFRRDYVPAASQLDLPETNPATLGQPEAIYEFEPRQSTLPATRQFVPAPSAARVWRSSFR